MSNSGRRPLICASHAGDISPSTDETCEQSIDRATKYFKKYNLEDFLTTMLSELGTNVPEDPYEFMIIYIERMKFSTGRTKRASSFHVSSYHLLKTPFWLNWYEQALYTYFPRLTLFGMSSLPSATRFMFLHLLYMLYKAQVESLFYEMQKLLLITEDSYLFCDSYLSVDLIL